MRPQNLKSKIFLDGGDPVETREFLDRFGFLDGQTTNPSLIAKNPEAKARMDRGEKFTEQELLDFYKNVVRNLSSMIPQASISIEVYADAHTTADQMFAQGREMFTWIPNAHIKYPTTTPGLVAANRSIQAGMRVNMTLCFQQEQAAAVYAATQGARRGDVFVSPFVGRLDDRNEDGMELIKNIIKMYEPGDGHVEVLTASVRTLDHFLYALRMGSDIITSPYKVLKQWAEMGLPIPGPEYQYPSGALKPIAYRPIDLNKNFGDYDIKHDLTDSGQAKFAADWNALLK